MKIQSSELRGSFSVAAGSGCWGDPNDFRPQVNTIGYGFLMNFSTNLPIIENTGKTGRFRVDNFLKTALNLFWIN